VYDMFRYHVCRPFLVSANSDAGGLGIRSVKIIRWCMKKWRSRSAMMKSARSSRTAHENNRARSWQLPDQLLSSPGPAGPERAGQAGERGVAARQPQLPSGGPWSAIRPSK